MEMQEATKNKIDALAVVAIAASSLFVTVGGYVISEHGKRLDNKDLRITALEISVARALEHMVAHDASTQIRLSRLETEPSARPNAFTSTDGARLERMINNLHQKLENTND